MQPPGYIHGFHLPGTLVPYGAAAAAQAAAAALPPPLPYQPSPTEVAATAAKLRAEAKRKDVGRRISYLARALASAGITPTAHGDDVYYPLAEFEFFYQERNERSVGFVRKRLWLGVRPDGRPYVGGMYPQPESWESPKLDPSGGAIANAERFEEFVRAQGIAVDDWHVPTLT